MKTLLPIIFLYACLAVPFETGAQHLPVNLRFSKFTTENGLSDNCLYDMLQDMHGYLWIATQNGLNRFDGVEFKTFYHDPDDSNSLLNNYLNFLAEDTSGNIWMATAGGLSRYDPVSGTFRNFVPSQNEFNSARVYKVIKAHDGSIWFTTRYHLNNIDPVTFQITSYNLNPDGVEWKNITADNFFQDHNGDFWMDSNLGLLLFNLKSHKVKIMDKDFGLSGFYDDGSGECWMGCWFHGLRSYNFGTGKFTDYFFKPGADNVTRDITGICKIKSHGLESYLWVATERELAVFDLRTKTFQRYYEHDAALQSSLSPGFIYKIFYEGGDEIMLCTQNGLNVAGLKQLAIQTYIFPDLVSSRISRIREDIFDPSVLHIGLFPGGVLSLNKSTGKIVSRYIPEKKMVYGFNYIEDFLQDRNGAFRLASHDGLGSFDPATSNYLQYSEASKSFQRENKTIYSLTQGSDSVMWCAGLSGLEKFDTRTNSFVRFHHSNDLEKDPRGSGIRQVIKDYNQNLWIITMTSGLWTFNPRTGKFSDQKVDMKDWVSAVSYDLIQSRDSSIWYSTGYEVYFKKPGEQEFHSFPIKKSMGAVFSLAFDHKNNILLGTQNGLFKYEKANGRTTKFTTSDGFYENRFLQGFDAGSNGDIYVRGAGYITVVNPDLLEKENFSFPLVLESVKVNDRDTIIDFAKFVKEPLVLNYRQNQFSAVFRLLNFHDPKSATYACKLEGWDKDWISTGAGNYASYSNLAGGDYTLRIKAINTDGIENLQQATLKIHVDGPYWETLWFRLLISLAVSSLIYFIYRMRIQRLLAVERIRSQISRDLHDEIGASLSSVQIMSAFAEETLQGTSPDTRRWVNRIGSNTKEMMEKIRDIVWTLNSANEISGNIIIRMNQYISHTLEPKDITCNFIADEKVNEALTDFVLKRNVYLIFKEAVNNAAKYADCNEVNISIKTENRNLLLNISDNGKGFNPAMVNSEHGGNGLVNMRLRATQINATLDIKSSPGTGTSVLLVLPLPHLRYRFWKTEV